MDTDSKVEAYYDKITENNFMPLITIPTRIMKSSKTLIDNILTNRFVEGTVAGNLTVSISDHIPQFCIISYQMKTAINLKTKPSNSNETSSNLIVLYFRKNCVSFIQTQML